MIHYIITNEYNIIDVVSPQNQLYCFFLFRTLGISKLNTVLGFRQIAIVANYFRRLEESTWGGLCDGLQTS